ncbi:MAG: hypothetical protein KJO21_12625 [Verrucomicrobiae bacterium]|nr:hypothetical protein [Verrucomicrobiae bacterium]NNJ43571.1 hypothetical protein [Akkermansiaceae bacterium]
MKEPDSTITPDEAKNNLQKKFFRPLLILGLLIIAGVASMPWLGEVGMASDKATTVIGQWIGFLGRFHPIFLHLPIGALTLVLLMECLGLISLGKYKPHTTLGLGFASATGVFAVVFGYFLYLTGDYSGELIEEHKRDGVIFTILLIATFLIKYAHDIRFMTKLTRPVYAIGLIATTATMFSAGHHGGEVSHGNPFDKAPWIQKSDKPTSAAEIADPVVYKKIIHPILDAKCVSCHGDKKQKSGLRVDSYAGLLDGGEETDALIPGDLKKSALISYLHLPLDDDLRMPPEGKTQLTQEEIQILEWWVKIGAPEHAKRSEVEITPAIATAIDTLKTPEEIAQAKAAKREAEHQKLSAMKQKREQLAISITRVNQQFPGSLNYISQDSTELSFSAVSYRKNFTDENLTAIKDAAADITDLDLGASALTDKGAAMLDQFTQVKVLKINQTSITDAALPIIAKLDHLQSLNLYGTAVTDAGIKALYGKTSLKKVYLWDTQVTEAGAKALQQDLTKSHAKAQAQVKKEHRDNQAPQVILGSTASNPS